MATRSVTATVNTPHGLPWAGCPVTFTTMPTQYTASAHFPVHTIAVQSGDDGGIAVSLEPGIRYRVAMPGDTFEITVPVGVGAITLEELRG